MMMHWRAWVHLTGLQGFVITRSWEPLICSWGEQECGRLRCWNFMKKLDKSRKSTLTDQIEKTAVYLILWADPHGALTQSHVTAEGETNERNSIPDCRSSGFLRFLHDTRLLKSLLSLWCVLTQILELTLLMASYINHWNSNLPSTAHQPLGHWDVDSRHFPAMNYTTKGPTLLWMLQVTSVSEHREASVPLSPSGDVGTEQAVGDYFSKSVSHEDLDWDILDFLFLQPEGFSSVSWKWTLLQVVGCHSA